jgi:hypothetical protein
MISYISELDSKRFGISIARIDNTQILQDEFLAGLKEQGVKLIISRVECEKTDLINHLEDLNFRTMDFQITYRYNLDSFQSSNNSISSDYVIREANTNDIIRLKQIAAESFYNYGHYFADKRLEREKCIEIYKDWIERSISEKAVADIVFVAEKNKELAGFLSFRKSSGDLKFAAGVQGAVAKKFRSQNVFKLLVLEGLKWGNTLGLEWEEHNVLLTNYPVNRSFLKLGFLPVKSFTTLHLWLD